MFHLSRSFACEGRRPENQAVSVKKIEPAPINSAGIDTLCDFRVVFSFPMFRVVCSLWRLIFRFVFLPRISVKGSFSSSRIAQLVKFEVNRPSSHQWCGQAVSVPRLRRERASFGFQHFNFQDCDVCIIESVVYILTRARRGIRSIQSGYGICSIAA